MHHNSNQFIHWTRGDDWKKWLLAPMKELLVPCPSDLMQKWQVSREVGKPSFNEASCIEPVVDEGLVQGEMF